MYLQVWVYNDLHRQRSVSGLSIVLSLSLLNTHIEWPLFEEDSNRFGLLETNTCMENGRRSGSHHHSHRIVRLAKRTKCFKTNQNIIIRRPTIRSVVCKYETRITNWVCDLINIAHNTSWSLTEQWTRENHIFFPHHHIGGTKIYTGDKRKYAITKKFIVLAIAKPASFIPKKHANDSFLDCISSVRQTFKIGVCTFWNEIHFYSPNKNWISSNKQKTTTI